LNVTVPGEQWKGKVVCGGADECVKRIIVGARLIGEVDLVGRQVKRLVRGIAEEVGEEVASRMGGAPLVPYS
jgi:hypothetical protein